MEVSYKTIGSNIKKARKAQKLTQAQVAELIGISLLHFGRLERGDRNVSLAQLARVADALHVPFDSLLAGSISSEQGIIQYVSDTASDLAEEDKVLIAELYHLMKKHMK